MVVTCRKAMRRQARSKRLRVLLAAGRGCYKTPADFTNHA
jgi:hypothetical protein